MKELIQLASDICGTPISLTSLLTADRQVILSSVGTDLTETPLEMAFCSHTVAHGDLFVVEDAARDTRFQDNPLVAGEPHIRFYAGVPLRWPDGESRGALCVIDRVARKLTARQESALRTLAHQVELRFELMEKQEKLERSLKENAELAAKAEESNAMFSAFMKHAPFPCYVKDADGRMLFYNKTCAEQFQVTEQAWLGRLDHDLWPKELADEFRRHDLEVMRQWRMMELFERTEGEGDNYTHWKSYKFPIPRGDGTTMVAGISIDFTGDLERESKLLRGLDENLKLSRSLEASKNLLQGFLDNVPYFTYIKTTDGRFVSYNQRFADYFGISRTEWAGRATEELFPEELAATYREQDREVLRRGEPVTTIHHNQDSHGVDRTFKATKFLLEEPDGSRLIGGVSYDITAEVQLEAQRGQMVASTRMAALGMMAGGVAHEINNPLAIIQMAAGDLVDGLEREPVDREEMMHCAKDVMQTSVRIKKIVDSMRTMSRDGSKDKPTVCAAGTIVEETLELCRQRFRNSRVRLEVGEVDPSLRIACQQAQLGQVLLNLLMNAYDAAAEGAGEGWVRVEAGLRRKAGPPPSAKEDNISAVAGLEAGSPPAAKDDNHLAKDDSSGWVVFSVTDSGAGVPEELRARIMEPFFTTKEIGMGTGLGLSISRTIVTEHGGMLQLSDEHGHTCFSFQIPRMEEKATPCN